MGVAVQSHFFSVGSAVPWGEPGAGVVATQSIANLDFGPEGLGLMSKGVSPEDALAELLKGDEGRDYRQVSLCSAGGSLAVHTGSKCIAEAGHIKGNFYTVQANMMLKRTVWKAMSQAFEGAAGPLSMRMLTALKAAEDEGGDIRGRQSAAMLIVSTEDTGKTERARIMDPDHPEVEEMEDLLEAGAASGQG